MRKLFSFLLICFGATMLHAQRPAVRGLFEQMPDSLLPLVNAQARQALTHAYVLGTDALVRDVMNTEVVLDTLGEEFMQLRTSPVSTLQLRLLHTTDSTTLIALVESVEANGSVSSIRFFNDRWTEQHWLDFPMPTVRQFVGDDADRDVAAQLEALPLISIQAEGNAPVFTLRLSLSPLDEEARRKAPRQAPTLRVRWDGNQFQMPMP